MKDILKDVLSKVELSQTIKAIADKGIEKLAISIAGATVLDLFEVFLLLMFLELIDIYTACVYQASLLWQRMYDKKIVERHGNLINYTRWIWSAHHWRFVDSSILKDGFLSKSITYGLLICTGQAIDTILAIRHTPPVALTIFCLVMACTEGLSICENLDSAGIKIGGNSVNFYRKRRRG